jgi:hypothetical protein
MGKITCAGMITKLSAVDGGEGFRQAWTDRKKRFLEYYEQLGCTFHKEGRWEKALP